MKQQLGVFLQFITLVFLPLLIIWQINWGFDLIWMPACLLGGIIIFSIGNALRER